MKDKNGKKFSRESFLRAIETPGFLEHMIRLYTGLNLTVDGFEIVEKDENENPHLPTADIIVHTAEGTEVHLVLPDSISESFVERIRRKERETGAQL